MSYTELSSTYPKSKKIYYCEWCGEKILKGEKHLKRVYLYDNEFEQGRMHLECEKAMLESDSFELQEGWSFGSNTRGGKMEIEQ